MRKFNFQAICLLALTITVLTSFQSHQKEGKTRYENFEFDKDDLLYDSRGGDFAENKIRAVDTESSKSAGLIMCPGTGERCTVWLWDGDHPTIFLAKKTVGGPAVVIEIIP